MFKEKVIIGFNKILHLNRPSERITAKQLLIELVEGYLAIFPSKKERLWKPFVFCFLKYYQI